MKSNTTGLSTRVRAFSTSVEPTSFQLVVVQFKAVNTHATCSQCDWECFRDPSILFGPLLAFLAGPVKAVARFCANPGFFKLWLADLRYYRACRFFRCTTPPNYKAMIKCSGICRD